MVSHLEVIIPDKLSYQRTLVKVYRVLRDNYGKIIYFCNMTRTEISALFRLPYQSNPSLKEKNHFVHSLLKILRKVTVMMHRKLLHANAQVVVIRFKALIFISPTVQWNMLTHSEPTLLSQICIDSLPGFWMSVINFRIKMLPFMK